MLIRHGSLTVAQKVLDELDRLFSEYELNPDTITVGAFQNCREQGYSVYQTLHGDALCFYIAEHRTSDMIIAYESKLATNAGFVDYETPHTFAPEQYEKTARYVLERFAERQKAAKTLYGDRR